MSGLYLLGHRHETVSVPRSDATLGWVFADYSWGQTQFKELEAYFSSLGKPQQFRAAFDALKAAYDDAETVWAVRAVFVADKMKTVGEQSVTLRKQIEGWASSQGKGAAPLSSVPDAPPPPSGVVTLLPWWGWALVAVGGLGLVAFVAVPPIASAVAASKRLSR
jgi:hypothetical protein